MSITLCSDCVTAAKQPHFGFTLGCRGCAARTVSRGTLFFNAKQAERGTEDGDTAREAYRQLLEYMGLTHQQVRDASWLDAGAKAPLLLEP